MKNSKCLFRWLTLIILMGCFALFACGAPDSVVITIIPSNHLEAFEIQGKPGSKSDFEMTEVDDNVFEGFYFDAELTDFFGDKITSFPSKSITLYAKYNKKALYRLAFDTAGGTQIKSLDIFAGESLSSYIPAAPTKIGYTFDGWVMMDNTNFEEAQLFSFDSTMPSNNITLQAKWSKDLAKCFYKFILGNEVYREVPLDFGEPLERPQNPLFDSSLIFDDWYASKQGARKVTFGTMELSELTKSTDEPNTYLIYGNYYSKGLVFEDSSVVAFNSSDTNVVVPWTKDGTIITEIAPVAFANKRIRNASLPSTITIIGERAFYACAQLDGITLPKQLATIGQEAFARCSKISKITIPKNAQLANMNVFSGCDALTEIFVEENSQYYSAHAGGLYSSDGEKLLMCAAGLSEFEVKDGTLAIARLAFDSKNLKQLIIADSVLSIENGAIRSETSALEKITLPAVDNSEYNLGANKIKIFNLAAVFGAERYTDNMGGNIYINSIYVPHSLKTVIINRAISELSYSFYGCFYVENIVLPNSGIDYIGAGTFFLCYSLKEIVIPNSVKKISGGSILDAAFYYCYSLKKITLPYLENGYLSYIFGASHYSEKLNIGEVLPFTFFLEEVCLSSPDITEFQTGAFYGLRTLKRITTESKLQRIGVECFYDCNMLETIEGLGYVTEIAFDIGLDFYSGAFVNCYNLKELSSLTLSSGIIGKDAFRGAGNLDTPFTLIIGEGVLGIMEYAFSGAKLSEISLPNSLTYIGSGAFYGCELLTSLTVPATVQVIAPKAFEGCNSLSKLEMPMLSSIEIVGDEGVQSAFFLPIYFGAITLTDNKHGAGVGEQYHVPRSLKTLVFNYCVEGIILHYSFYNCEFIEEISLSENLVEIGENAFFGCLSLTFLKIPASVTEIDAGAFAYSSSLAEYVVSPSNQSFSTHDGVLYSLDRTRLISYPCGKKAETFLIIEGVVHIESFAFAGNKNIREVNLPKSIQSVGVSIFQNCENLVTVTTQSSSFEASFLNYGMLVGKPDGVLYAYFGMSTEVTLPNSIVGIASYAFSGLSYIQRISIGSGVKSIGSYAFLGISSIVEFDPLISIEAIGEFAFYGYKGREITLPSSLTVIEDSAFENSELVFISIPSGVERIGDYAFFNCAKLEGIGIEWDSSLERIGVAAFAQCNIGSFDIPKNLVSIGDHAFSFNRLVVFDSIGTTLSEIGKYSFYANLLQIIKVSGKINTISEGAFAYNADLYELTIEEGVSIIDDFAFSADIRQFGSLNPLSMLSVIDIPSSVERIGNSAFYGVGHYVLPSGEEGMYWYFTSAISLTFAAGSKLREIGDNAFDMTRLNETLDLSGTMLESIGDYAFANFVASSMYPDYYSLRRVIFPSSLKEIGEGAFFAQVSLSELTLPALVDRIGDLAFHLCGNLEVVRVEGHVPPQIGQDSFSKGTIIFIPLDSQNAYYTSESWQAYLEQLKTQEQGE